MYKAVSFKITPNFNTKRKTSWNMSFAKSCIRYKIIDEETGEVLDDADGYGYKTAMKAMNAYRYKLEKKERNW